MIPKTRSGKTLRRCLRELVENGTQAQYAREINVPATVEDKDVVEVARERVKEYFEKTKEAETRTLLLPGKL
jgi:propionyl-CoA synthetase